MDGSAVRFESCPRGLKPESIEKEEESLNKTLKSKICTTEGFLVLIGIPFSVTTFFVSYFSVLHERRPQAHCSKNLQTSKLPA